MEPPLALYRRYRPETFAEVIGQDHVTEPLRAALAQQPGQPRLPLLRPARLRQDHQRPDPGPRAQLRAGADRRPVRRVRLAAATWPAAAPGSIDVIEIDAASPRRCRRRPRPARAGVLRAGAAAATRSTSSTRPTWSRTQGFNALLKLVEEPPQHLQVHLRHDRAGEGASPTIRSRTHHYPFRLIPPRLLSTTSPSCARRRASPIEPAALPARRPRRRRLGPRHALGARPAARRGRRRRASPTSSRPALLGYTPDTLLDEVVDAFAAGDGAAVFGVVDKVIETGQDPRRFTEDLLRRLRDLVDRRGGARRPGHRADRRLRGPGRAAGRPGRPLRRRPS